MTALDAYDRLESGGLWRPAPEAQRREVTVGFGATTLVLSDSAGRPVSHWSLPAIRRLNPGDRPAVYTPDETDAETLEVDEPEMIDAIETVRKSLARRRPRRGALRGVGVLLSLAVVAGLAWFWLPDALREHTLRVVPPAKREAIGEALLFQLATGDGAACADRGIRPALARLRARVLPDLPDARLVLLHQAPRPALWLPGDLVALDARSLEDQDSADVLAGEILAARVTAAETDPLSDLLEGAGFRATFRLLTTGDLDPEVIRAHSIALRSGAAPMRPPPASLLPAFAEAQVPASPYALFVDPSGERVRPLIEADPFPEGPPEPVLGDFDWLTLQQACDR